MDRPKLRKVERIDSSAEDGPSLVLRDPLGVSESFAVDAEFAPVFDLLDGTRTIPQIRQSLLMRAALDLPSADLSAFVSDLRSAGWLDDDHFRARWAELHRAFVEAPHRPATLAGLTYPASRQEIIQELEQAVPPGGRTISGSEVAGVLTPHGPPPVVGSVLDATLRALPPAEELDLIAVFGTDHNAGLLPYAMTWKSYQTPLGIVPSATDIVADLEDAHPWCIREEIRHRTALSTEFAALYLQHIYGQACPPTAMVLCGQTVLAASHTTQARDFCATLSTLCRDRRVLIWGCAELTHAGPVYGGGALGRTKLGSIAERDLESVEVLATGSVERLIDRCREPGDFGQPSGGAVMTSLAAVLPAGYRTRLAKYEMLVPHGCDPDPASGGTGRIGAAGVQFLAPVR